MNNQNTENEHHVYVGTYTFGDSDGIYLCRFDTETGALGAPEFVAAADNPTFLAVHPNGKWVYGISEVRDHGGQSGGAVQAFARDALTGALSEVNHESTGGEGPCHLGFDNNLRVLMVANYNSGSFSAFPIDTDGALGESIAFFQHEGSSVNPRRQTSPHAHSANISTDNRFAFVCDLGTDEVVIYALDGNGPAFSKASPASASVAPGAGPRHLAGHPNDNFVYVINEMGSTVTVFSYEPAGEILREVQTISTLPDDYEGESTTAEVVVSPDGRFLYGSNRGHDSIAVFSIAEDSGQLSLIQWELTRGESPRNFVIDPTGNFLLAANENTHSIVVLKRDTESGRLAYAGNTVAVPNPVCLRFVP